MGIFDSINRLLKGAGKVVDELNEKSTIYLEESKIQSRAQEAIKTDNFSSDLEKTIMLAAAEKEVERKRELAAKLASDPVLSKFYSEALARIQAIRALDTVRSVRLADEAAMNSAVRQRLLHARLGKDPELRKVHEVAPERLVESDETLRAEDGASCSDGSNIDSQEDTLPGLFRKIRDGQSAL